MLLATIACLTTAIGLASTANVLRWREKNSPKRSRVPGVTILKPIRGLEPDLAINLHSFFNLEASVPWEIIFCVKDPNDPCLPVIRDLMGLHPQVNARLMTGTPDLGRNPKVSNMYRAWCMASYDLVLISDSNVSVAPDYIDMLLAERELGASLVTQAVYGTGARTLGGHLDVVHLNSFYLKGTAFVGLFGFPCVLGKCMLFSRTQFEDIGGLYAVRNYLAEDLVAGEMMKEAGQTVAVASSLLKQTTVMTTFKTYWNRHVRWARLRKCHFFGAYLIEPLMFESFWPVLLMIARPTPPSFAVGAGCLSLQMISNLILYKLKFRDQSAWSSLKWFWLKDILAPVIWFAGLVSNKVNWRGQILELRFGGKLGTKYLRAARRRLLTRKLAEQVVGVTLGR